MKSGKSRSSALISCFSPFQDESRARPPPAQTAFTSACRLTSSELIMALSARGNSRAPRKPPDLTPGLDPGDTSGYDTTPPSGAVRRDPEVAEGGGGGSPRVKVTEAQPEMAAGARPAAGGSKRIPYRAFSRTRRSTRRSRTARFSVRSCTGLFKH